MNDIDVSTVFDAIYSHGKYRTGSHTSSLPGSTKAFLVYQDYGKSKWHYQCGGHRSLEAAVASVEYMVVEDAIEKIEAKFDQRRDRILTRMIAEIEAAS